MLLSRIQLDVLKKGVPQVKKLKGPRVYNFTHVTEERQWVKVS